MSANDELTEGTNPNFLKPGQKVGGGNFTLIKMLGRGGMGVVWLARDESLNEDVALKFLPPEVAADAIALDDLRRETRKSRRLTHPQIMRIHAFHGAPGEPAFISMEFVDGPNLTSLRLQQPQRCFTWKFLEPLMRQLCMSLDYAHGEKIIHRDLKPSNLMLDAKGRLKLADFGIAATMSDSMNRVSLQNATSGTLVYMSPQQLRGETPRATDDIYALGATFYELLTSKPPFFRGDIADQVKHETLQPMAERLHDFEITNPIPEPVKELVMACLAKDAAQRPQSTLEILKRLDTPAPAPTATSAPTPATQTGLEAAATIPGSPPTRSDPKLRLPETPSYPAPEPDATVVAKKITPPVSSPSPHDAGVGRGPGRGAPILPALEPAPTPLPPEPDTSPVAKKIIPPVPSPSPHDAGVGRGSGRGASISPAMEPAPTPPPPEPIISEPPRSLSEEFPALKKAHERVEAGQSSESKRGMNWAWIGAVVIITIGLAWYWVIKSVDKSRVDFTSGTTTNAAAAASKPAESPANTNTEPPHPKDWQKTASVAELQKAADNSDSSAMVELGNRYYSGAGVTKDYAEAVEWYRKSADAGNVEAENNLGAFYQNGYAVAQDYNEALKWYRKAVDAGYAKSEDNLGYMYLKGYGVTQDYNEALKWYRKAADAGYLNAENSVGFFYMNGWGVTQDYDEALKWYRKAADGGDAASKGNLGYMYENGWGLTKDREQAIQWYQKAAAQGNAFAQAALKRLGQPAAEISDLGTKAAGVVANENIALPPKPAFVELDLTPTVAEVITNGVSMGLQTSPVKLEGRPGERLSLNLRSDGYSDISTSALFPEAGTVTREFLVLPRKKGPVQAQPQTQTTETASPANATDLIVVPSAEELKNGAKIRVVHPGDPN
jgi:TPR repeat protein/serine/threonine protein kinase